MSRISYKPSSLLKFAGISLCLLLSIMLLMFLPVVAAEEGPDPATDLTADENPELTSETDTPEDTPEIDPVIAPAFNRVRAEIAAQGIFTEEEMEGIMARIRAEFRRMARAGISGENIEEVANQACRMLQMMTNNAGEQRKIGKAVALMAKETIDGNNPQEIGDMLRNNLQSNGDMDKAVIQTQAEIRERLREEKKDQKQEEKKNKQGASESSAGTGSGNNGTGNSGKNSAGNGGSGSNAGKNSGGNSSSGNGGSSGGGKGKK